MVCQYEYQPQTLFSSQLKRLPHQICPLSMVWRYHFPIVHRCTICKNCVPNAIVTVSPLNQTLWLFISLFLLHSCYFRLAFYYRVAFILLAGQQISMSWLPTYLAAMYDHSMHYEAMRLTHCWADMVDTPLFGAMWQLQYTHPLSHTVKCLTSCGTQMVLV